MVTNRWRRRMSQTLESPNASLRPPTRVEQASYIEDTLTELGQLAKSAGFSFLGYLIGVAKLQAHADKAMTSGAEVAASETSKTP